MAARDTKWRIRSKNLTWREVDGDVIALDLASSTYFSTNTSGRTLWLSLVEGATQAELIALLVHEYGISENAADNDVAQFLSGLEATGLIERG